MSEYKSSKNFKEIWDQKRTILQDDPNKASVTVRADSKLVQGFMSEVKTRHFECIVDQNKGMGGSDKGPRPSEYVLVALAACHEVTYRLWADAMGIPLESIAVSVTGHSDARGFFGLDDSKRAGFSHVTGEVHISSSASDEDLESLRNAVNAHCPVLDDLQKPVEVIFKLVRK